MIAGVGVETPEIDILLGKLLRLNASDVGILVIVTGAMVAEPMW